MYLWNWEWAPHTYLPTSMMATLNYVDIPSCATRLPSNSRAGAARPSPKVITSLPRPEQSSSAASSPVSAQPLSSTLSPSKLALNSIPQLLLSSTLSIPANAPTAPRSNSSISGTGGAKGVPRLLSGRDPLSIPITTVNFKRFVSKVGPVFWLQDRLEEIVMWRKGSKYTGVWMATYAFLCASVLHLFIARCADSRLNRTRLLPKIVSVTPICNCVVCNNCDAPRSQSSGRI